MFNLNHFFCHTCTFFFFNHLKWASVQLSSSVKVKKSAAPLSLLCHTITYTLYTLTTHTYFLHTTLPLCCTHTNTHTGCWRCKCSLYTVVLTCTGNHSSDNCIALHHYITVNEQPGHHKTQATLRQTVRRNLKISHREMQICLEYIAVLGVLLTSYEAYTKYWENTENVTKN